MSGGKREKDLAIKKLKKEIKEAKERKEELENKLNMNLDKAKRVLKLTKSFNAFLELENLEITVESEEDDTIKKRFEASAKIGDVLFDISYLVCESKENSKYFDDIRVKMKEELHQIELQPSLNILKRQKDLKYIYDCIKSFSILNSKRIIVLNSLQKKYSELFAFERNSENGGYTVNCYARNTNKKLFYADWRIQWVSSKYSLCYVYEFFVDKQDEAIMKGITPIIENLCEMCLNVDESIERLKYWKNLMILIVNIDVEISESET